MEETTKKETEIQIFFRVLKKHFFTLVFLNLVFVVSCIPIITIASASRAMTKVMMDMIREKEFSIVRAYFEEMKTHFLKQTIIGTPIVLVMGGMIYLVVLTIQEAMLEASFSYLIAIASIVILFIFAILLYLQNLLVTVSIPIGKAIKNSFLLVFLSPVELLILLVTVVIPTVCFAWFFSIGFSFFIILHFSYVYLVTSVIAWKIIRRYVVNNP